MELELGGGFEAGSGLQRGQVEPPACTVFAKEQPGLPFWAGAFSLAGRLGVPV